ncbi:hypothetical protein SMMN14_08038 [Sphaerulina musiva]
MEWPAVNQGKSARFTFVSATQESAMKDLYPSPTTVPKSHCLGITILSKTHLFYATAAAKGVVLRWSPGTLLAARVRRE